MRFGEAPSDGISRDHRTGRYEPGLSVFPALEIRGKYYADPGESDLGRMALRLYLWLGFRAFEATGRVSGTGTCGEPCLTDFALIPIPAGRARNVSELGAEVCGS